MENYNNLEGEATPTTSEATTIAAPAPASMPVIPELVLPPLTPVTPLVIPATATKVDRATRIANEKARVQSRIDKVTVWQGKNASGIVRLSGAIDKINSEIAKAEAELATLGATADVNSTNNKVRRFSIHLANLKNYLAKRQAQLEKATTNKDKIVKYLANNNEHLSRVNAMATSNAPSTTEVVAVPASTSSADGVSDPYSNSDGDYSGADGDYSSAEGYYSSAEGYSNAEGGFSIKSINKKDLLVGMVIGAGVMFLALKYRSKLGF
jgi:hypothetical protein